MLIENGTTTNKLNATYKKYVKDLLCEYIENVAYVKHNPKIEEKQLTEDTTQSEFISQVAENFPTKVI